MMIKKNIFISLKNSIWFRKNKTELEHFWENTWPKGKTNTRFFFSLWKSISKRTKKRFTNTKKEIKNPPFFFKNCIIKWEKHNSTQFRILPIAKNKQKEVKECVSLSNHAFPLFLYDWHHIWSIIEHV